MYPPLSPLPQVPLPTGDVWLQFPLVAVIVLVIALLGLSVFGFTKWIWGQYKIERDKDLAWREDQNAKREAAIAEQNRLWRESVIAMNARYEQYDRQRQGTLEKISASLESVAADLKAHDMQAKEIGKTVNRVEENTRPLPGQPGYERRKE